MEELNVHKDVVVPGNVILGQDPVTPSGEDETAKLTVPWKPPEPVMVITSPPVVPLLKFTVPLAGLMVKSPLTTPLVTVAATLVVRVAVPTVPVTAIA